MLTTCLDKNRFESRIISCTTSTDSSVPGPKGVTTCLDIARFEGSPVFLCAVVSARSQSDWWNVSTPSVFLSLILAYFYPLSSLSKSVTIILRFSSFTCSFCSFSLRFFVVHPYFSLNMLSLLLNFVIFSKRNKKIVEALTFSENNPHLKKNQNLLSSSLEHLPFPNIKKLRTMNSVQHFSHSPQHFDLLSHSLTLQITLASKFGTVQQETRCTRLSSDQHSGLEFDS